MEKIKPKINMERYNEFTLVLMLKSSNVAIPGIMEE